MKACRVSGSGWVYGGPQETIEWMMRQQTRRFLKESNEHVQGPASSVSRQAATQQAAVQAAQRALEDSGPAVSLPDFQQGKVQVIPCFSSPSFLPLVLQEASPSHAAAQALPTLQLVVVLALCHALRSLCFSALHVRDRPTGAVLQPGSPSSA